jgi:hypothetical protein
MSGSWTTLTNAPPAAVATTLLLTDGTVLAQGVSTNKWYRLTPDAHGDYLNGTWTTLADSVHAPLYYASGVLRDGRVLVFGGEYDAGAAVWLLNAEMYDPVANTWTTLPTPAGWVRGGDMPGSVLPDGRFIAGQILTRNTAIYDPTTNSWTAAANKINTVGEESWSLLPDGTIVAVDCSNPPNAEKYIIAADTWVAAGATPDVLVDSISEIGASVLLPDGRMFVIGATGPTALYTPPAVANQPGTWTRGPTIPQVNPGEPLGAVDGPACVLPNGNVLFNAGPITNPATFKAPAYFFEYDPTNNTITAVASPVNSNTAAYVGRMLMLPTGDVLYTSYSTTVEIYAPSGGPDPTWLPTITGAPASVRRGQTYQLAGRQINGLTQCCFYGNDATMATNYPLVRLRSVSGGDTYYCRTSNYSTMGVQTGTTIQTCNFRVPASVPIGSYCLEVVVNGIASACRTIGVTNKRFKEIKFEIKEKLEVLENFKDFRDTKSKHIPDIIDRKGIREDIEIFEHIEEEWTKTVREIAESIDAGNRQLARSFITPEERPEVGPPEPEIEELRIPRATAEDLRLYADKYAFVEKGRSAEAEAMHELVHDLWKSGGKLDITGDVRRATRGATKKATTKKATVKKKAVAKKSVAKKTGRPGPRRR